jgi:HEXXH motif-containing protein
MPLTAHTITARQVRAIADGSSGPSDLAVLVSGQRSKNLAMIALVAQSATAARHPEAAAAAHGACLLAQVQRLAPRAAEAIVRYPAVGSWAAETALGRGGPSAATAPTGRLALVAAAAAIRGGVPFTIGLPPSVCTGATLELPSLGSVVLPDRLRGSAVRLRHRDGLTEIIGSRDSVTIPAGLNTDSPGWHAVPTIGIGTGEARLVLRLDDCDPYRFSGNPAEPVPVTAADQDAWRHRLAGAWTLLTRDHPAVARDIATLIVTVTPLRPLAGALLSATSRRAFGTVAMSLPDSDVNMALALAHEIQHAKLSALMDLLPLVSDRASGRYYAPWRDDPRLLASVIQGMYAHLGVARFWRRHRQVAQDPAEVRDAHVEFARWRQSCGQVAEVIRGRPELTRCGALFVAGMERLLRSWADDYVPPRALAQADQATAEHRERWIGQHGGAIAPPWPTRLS